MATITKIEGSPLMGNPITATVVAGSYSGDISFLRVKCQVIVDGTTIEMSSPVSNKETVTIDVASALRAVADKYVYTSGATSYPRYAFQVRARDEYLLEGAEVTTDWNYFPSSSTYCYAIHGAYSDLERIKAGASMDAGAMSRKPTTSPEIVCVGETFAYTPNISGNLSVSNPVTAPESKVTTITAEGLQTINNRPVYALPADTSGDRYQFRFINGFGVLESVSLKCLRKTEMNITSTFNTIARKETFNSFSRGINRKSQDYETWKMSTPPLDKAWLSWYMHEFLMAEHVWIYVSSTWIRCHVIADDSIEGIDRTSTDPQTLTFDIRMDINGPVE